MELTIVIVNFNVKYFLEQCLYSVIKACKNIETEIIVIDNNSGDDSRYYLTTRFPSVKYIFLDHNVGFAKANNLACKEAKGEFILFLNPDTIVAEDSLIKSISFLKNKDQVGAVGVRMIDGSGSFLKESKRAFPSPITSFFKMIGFSSIFPKSSIFSKYHLGSFDEHKNHVVDVLAGAFLMIKKQVWEKVVGFDEQFFMYGEDIDLSYRIQKNAFINYYLAETSIIHFKGESTRKEGYNYVKMFYNAMQIFVQKHYSGKSAFFFNFFLHTAILFRAGVSSISFYLKKINFIKRNKFKKSNLAIIADLDSYNAVCQILKLSKNKSNIVGRITYQENSVENVLGNFNKLHEIIRLNKINEIVFCEKELSFKEIIDSIQHLPVHVRCLFHAYDSDSIVCSDNKNESGVYFVK